jgi:hypothetical protein
MDRRNWGQCGIEDIAMVQARKLELISRTPEVGLNEKAHCVRSGRDPSAE